MADYPERSNWVHSAGDSYVPVFGPIVGNADLWERAWRPVASPTAALDTAIKNGLRAMDSDDFNIAVVQEWR